MKPHCHRDSISKFLQFFYRILKKESESESQLFKESFLKKGRCLGIKAVVDVFFLFMQPLNRNV